MDHLDVMNRTFDATRQVVSAVRPEQLDSPSPCDGWTVRDVLNHLVGGMEHFAHAAANEDSEPFDFQHKAPDVVGDDPATAYDGAAKRCADAWTARGDLEGTARMLGNDSPAVMTWQANVGDSLIHGWDIATATGQTYPIDAPVAAEMYQRMNGMVPPEFRGQVFDEEVEVPADASALDHLIAYTGRTP
jgi:uncharacterized protein (TIGR03086 family)